MNLLEQVITALNLETNLENLNEKELNHSIDSIVYELIQDYIQSEWSYLTYLNRNLLIFNHRWNN